MSPRTIPEIRARLYEMAAEYGIDELRVLADETKREYHGRRAPAVNNTVTPEIAMAVRAYCKAFPKEAMDHVGVKFGINQGRVSEILFGKREERGQP